MILYIFYRAKCISFVFIRHEYAWNMFVELSNQLHVSINQFAFNRYIYAMNEAFLTNSRVFSRIHSHNKQEIVHCQCQSTYENNRHGRKKTSFLTLCNNYSPIIWKYNFPNKNVLLLLYKYNTKLVFSNILTKHLLVLQN